MIAAMVNVPIAQIPVPKLDSDYFNALWIAFASFVGAGLGLPFPEEILIMGAGIWTATANPDYGVFRWLMLPVCLVGVIIADCLLYGAGRLFGTRLLEFRFTRWMMPPEKLGRIEKNFHDYGVGILLFGRLLPGIRAPLFITAGILRLPMPKFILADSLGAVVGNGLLFFLAFWFGDQFVEFFKQLQHNIVHHPALIVMGLITVVLIYMVIHFVRKPVTEGDPNELPIIGHTIAEHMQSDDVKKSDAPLRAFPRDERTGKFVRSQGIAAPSDNGATPESKAADERNGEEQRQSLASGGNQPPDNAKTGG
jgi:membrane protein DedA with SNARE-associated domain